MLLFSNLQPLGQEIHARLSTRNNTVSRSPFLIYRAVITGEQYRGQQVETGLGKITKRKCPAATFSYPFGWTPQRMFLRNPFRILGFLIDRIHLKPSNSLVYLPNAF